MSRSCSSRSAAVVLALLSSLHKNQAEDAATPVLDCKPEAYVGHCIFAGCFMGHGVGVHCHRFSCLCDPGFCAADGSFCERAPSTTTGLPITTTDNFTKFDICGMREYMERGDFKKRAAICAISKCAKIGWQDAEKGKCCALQCSAEILKEDKKECWPQIAGALRHQWDENSIAQQYGMGGKSIAHHIFPAACPIAGITDKVAENIPRPGFGFSEPNEPDFLGPDTLAELPQVKEILQFSESIATLAIQSGRTAQDGASQSVIVLATCIMAMMAAAAGVHVNRRRSIQQRPLLA